MSEQREDLRPDDDAPYEAPHAEDLDTADSPSVTAALAQSGPLPPK
ncbi:MAG TPA: hypothetical protein VF587_13520 [Solirubrobacteraceae bacterium]